MTSKEIFYACLLLVLAIILITIFFIIYEKIIYPLQQIIKKKNEAGYILINNSKYEHRLIVEKILKRPLENYEVIHHINGKTWDNRRKNLALMTDHEHLRWHNRLSSMYANKKFPTLDWQKEKLANDFKAQLF